jgi:two-component sensor histidine kinase
MLLFALDLTLLYANEAHARMTGKPVAEILGRKMFDAFPSNPSESGVNAETAIQAVIDEIVKTGRPIEIEEQQHDILTPSGLYEQRFWSMVHWSILEQGETVAILQRSQDVTAQVRARRLIAAEKRAAELSSGLSFFSFDPETDIFDRSPSVEAMFGFKPGEVGPFAAPFFERVHRDDLPGVNAEVERCIQEGAGSAAAFDYRVEVPGIQKYRHVRVRAGVERDPDDGALKLFGAFVDMADVEKARTELQVLSQRNAELVVESNHRIKNSLAIASAMLSQQMRASENVQVQEALRLASGRIAAIADVHNELFKDTGVEQVDAGALVKQFANSFLRTVDDGGGRCLIDVDATELLLPSRYAVTIALTLNELLTNAIKYGMPEEDNCNIKVTLEMAGGKAVLYVANDLASNQVVKIASEGVGTRLITAFARQLGANIDTNSSDNRFEVRFIFPIPQEELERRDVVSATGE